LKLCVNLLQLIKLLCQTHTEVYCRSELGDCQKMQAAF
jgi:hypothetical protein